MSEQLGVPRSRSMGSVAAGVSEVRVRGKDGIYRAFYYTAHAEGIIVFHAFVKRLGRPRILKSNLEESASKEILDA